MVASMRDDEIRTIKGPATLEIERIKGSRFIADVAPVTDESTALAVVSEIQRRESAASHHCWAYRLAEGRERTYDAGEPGGTAGTPILRRIVGAELHDVLVVVTRYYGGTNLGKGGLSRAYGQSAAAGLAAATTVVRPILTYWTLSHSYELSSPVKRVTEQYLATVVSADYGEAVSLTVAIRAGDADDFQTELTNATGGTVIATQLLGLDDQSLN